MKAMTQDLQTSKWEKDMLQICRLDPKELGRKDDRLSAWEKYDEL